MNNWSIVATLKSTLGADASVWSNAMAIAAIIANQDKTRLRMQHLNQVGVAIMHGFKVQNGCCIAL